MASTSSKALPYISLAITFVISALGVFGYGMQVEQVVNLLAALSPILGTTAAGGLINKAIEAARDSRRLTANTQLIEAVKAEVIKQLEEAKAEGDKQP